ncbi:extended synaptotagmin-2 isoform X1 [Hydra vulgaris]|uniref:extended synaptotagmin-2 isoform X1 n=2 Tax=Hydra vulgaris TaxID=6087 RepID=UPI001F5E90E9|nr:extended synaptotagmin-2 isoform X1 [Hydra vulgaris]
MPEIETFKVQENHINILYALISVAFSWSVGWFGFSWSWVIGFFIFVLLWKNNLREKNLCYALMQIIYNNNNKDIQKNDQDLINKNKIRSAPSWAFFPDVERAEWLNQMIKQFWPFISKIMEDFLKTKVEPDMKMKLPSTIKSLKFSKTDLGNRPIRLGGIKVYSEHVPPNQIIADMELIYAGDALIELALDNGISGGISDIQIHGTMRIEITPLLSKLPLIGGISLYFIETPELNYNFTNLLNILDVPGISQIVNSLLKEALESFVVFPNRVKIPIGNPTDIETFRFYYPKGVLKIDILEAKNLIGKDTNLFKDKTSDPYVLTKVGSKVVHKTPVIQKSLNPKWNKESVSIFIQIVIGKKIKFELYDSDAIKDDEIGSTSLSLEKVVGSSFTDLWLSLDNSTTSALHINCGWFNLSNNVDDLKKQEECCLVVLLDHAMNLNVANKNSASAYVEITVNNTTLKSKTQRNTNHPVWEETFSFFLGNVFKDIVKLRVFDENENKPLGKIDFAVSALTDLPDMRLKQNFTLKNSFENSQIFMSLELKALVPPVSSK